MKKYKAVLFDLDGTLLDTSKGIYNAIHYAEKKMDLRPLSEEVLPSVVGPSSMEMYQTFHGLSPEDAKKAIAYHRSYQIERGHREFAFYPGITDLLKMLKECHSVLGVATLKRRDIAIDTLTAAGYMEYFQTVWGVSAEECETKAELMKAALKDMNIDPEDAVMVGDSSTDAIGADELHVDFIAAAYGFGFKTQKNLDLYNPVFIARFPEDLISFFDQHCIQ